MSSDRVEHGVVQRQRQAGAARFVNIVMLHLFGSVCKALLLRYTSIPLSHKKLPCKSIFEDSHGSGAMFLLLTRSEHNSTFL